MNDNNIINLIMNHLKKIFKKVPTPIWSNIWKFNKDKHLRGGLVCCPMNFNTFKSSLNNKVFFSGEYTTFINPGEMNGAYLSGISASYRLIETIKNKNIKSFHDYDFEHFYKTLNSLKSINNGKYDIWGEKI